jgi:hypothetical protein
VLDAGVYTSEPGVSLGVTDPDGIRPDSQEYIEKELGHLPAETRHKIVCENAAKLYRFVN